MTEIRCKKCRRLLFKEGLSNGHTFIDLPVKDELRRLTEERMVMEKDVRIEIICPKCKMLNKIKF